MSAGSAVTSSSTVVGKASSKALLLMAGQVLTGCWWEASVPTVWTFPQAMSVLRTWQPASPSASDKGERGGSCNVFYDLASEGTLCLFQNILLVTQPSLLSVGKDNTGGQGSPGTVLKAGYHASLIGKECVSPSLSLFSLCLE